MLPKLAMYISIALKWSKFLCHIPLTCKGKLENYVNVGPSKELFLFKLLLIQRFEISHDWQDSGLYFLLNSQKLFSGYSLPTQGFSCYSLSVALIRQPLPQPSQPDPCLAAVISFTPSLAIHFSCSIFSSWLLPPNTVQLRFSSLIWSMTSHTQLDCSFLSVFPDTCTHSA